MNARKSAGFGSLYLSSPCGVAQSGTGPLTVSRTLQCSAPTASRSACRRSPSGSAPGSPGRTPDGACGSGSARRCASTGRSAAHEPPATAVAERRSGLRGRTSSRLPGASKNTASSWAANTAGAASAPTPSSVTVQIRPVSVARRIRCAALPGRPKAPSHTPHSGPSGCAGLPLRPGRAQNVAVIVGQRHRGRWRTRLAFPVMARPRPGCPQRGPMVSCLRSARLQPLA